MTSPGSVRCEVLKVRYVPSGLQASALAFVLARKLTGLPSPPRHRHDVDVREHLGARVQIGDEARVGRPDEIARVDERRRIEDAGGDNLLLLGRRIDDAQLARIALERDPLAVGRIPRLIVARAAARQLRLSAGREVVDEDLVRAGAIGHIREPPAVWRPRELGFLARRGGDAGGVAAVFRRHREDLAVDRERQLLPIRRERQLLQLIGEALMLDTGGRGRAAQRDRHLARLARRRIDRPDAEIALECDRPAVPRNRRPQHAAVAERRHRLWRALRVVALHGDARQRPDVLRAAPVGHEVEALAARGPHRPRVLRAAAGDRRVDRARGTARLRGAVAHQPDLALVEMAVALAPPLRSRVGARGNRHHVTARRRRGEVFGRVAIRGHRHRRAAVGGNAIDIEHPGDLVAVR